MAPDMNRRAFVKGSLAAGWALGAGAAHAAAAPAAAPLAARQTIPQGRIGKLTIGRMLLGGNLLTHTTHSRDLHYVQNLCVHYNTEEKILETLRLAEAHGVNTLTVHYVPRVMEILKKHRRAGGKMQWIIGPMIDASLDPDVPRLAEQARQLMDDGCEALYLTGFHADALLAAGKGALIGEAVELFKANGVPVGVGAHDLRVVEHCEGRGVANDFYVKTFHHHNYSSAPKPDDPLLKWPTNEAPGFWCNDPPRVSQVMRWVKKPWIAFKVMAAGAIPPEDAFRYAFTHGADFCLAGMFDYEIAPNVETINRLLTPELPLRERPWMA